MTTVFTYINFNNLSGADLDSEFKQECFKNGANDNTEVSAMPVNSLTGHDAYLVTLGTKSPTSNNEESTIAECAH